MESTLNSFQERQLAVEKKHARMAQGYVTKLDPAKGVMVQQPDSKSGGLAFRVFLSLVFAAFMFKGFVLAWLGQDKYLAELAKLEAGTGQDQIGAWLMQIDPITAQLGQFLAGLLT